MFIGSYDDLLKKSINKRDCFLVGEENFGGLR